MKEKFPLHDEWTEGFAAHYPHLAQMREPLTQAEYEKILGRGFPNDIIKEKLERMDNMPHVEKKYVSTYRTLINWLRR